MTRDKQANNPHKFFGMLWTHPYAPLWRNGALGSSAFTFFFKNLQFVVSRWIRRKIDHQHTIEFWGNNDDNNNNRFRHAKTKCSEFQCQPTSCSAHWWCVTQLIQEPYCLKCDSPHTWPLSKKTTTKNPVVVIGDFLRSSCVSQGAKSELNLQPDKFWHFFGPLF